MISPMGIIYMEYLLLNTNIEYLTQQITALVPLKYLNQSDSDRMIKFNKKTNKILLNFINDTAIRKQKLQKIADNIPPGTDVSLTPLGTLLVTEADPRIALQDLGNRIFQSHVTYMNTIIPLKATETIGGTKLKKEVITNSYTNYSYTSTNTDLYNFMKLPFEVKHLIIKYSKNKEKIIKHVFDTFYKGASFDEQEFKVIKYCKKY